MIENDRRFEGEGPLLLGEVSLRQRQVVTALLAEGFEGEITKVLRKFNVKPAAFREWMREPRFVSFLKTQAAVVWQSLEPLVLHAIRRNIKAGDIRSLRTWLEVMSRIRSRTDVAVQVGDVYDFRSMTDEELRGERERILEAIAGLRRGRPDEPREEHDEGDLPPGPLVFPHDVLRDEG